MIKMLLGRYGELQGLNKKETADKFGVEKVYKRRRSYDNPPPKGESLEMCAKRAVHYLVEMVRKRNLTNAAYFLSSS